MEPGAQGGNPAFPSGMQQLGAAVGVAVIVSVYATGAVPGQFVPGAQAAFLTSAAFSVAALVVATLCLRERRTPDPAVLDPELEPELAEAA